MYKKNRAKGRSLRTERLQPPSNGAGIRKIIRQVYSSKQISRAQQVYLMSALLSNGSNVKAYRGPINSILEALQTGKLSRVDEV